MASPVTQALNNLGRSQDGRVIIPNVLYPELEIPAHPQYKENFPLWTLIRDCFAGEHVVKEAGELYLPKLSAHKSGEYSAYKQRAYFYNAVRRTAVGLMGSLFRKPPEFQIPPGMKVPTDTITLDGKSLDEFTRHAAENLVLTGRYGILVDIPRPDERTGRTGDPYLAGYTAESMYAWRVRLINGRKVLDRVILLESDTVLTEYGQEEIELVRVLRLDPDENGNLVYSQDVIRPDPNGELAPNVSNFQPKILGVPLDHIPFYFVNVTNNLPDIQAPPLLDIANLNVAHYQSTALLQHARFYAGMPTYVTSAGDDAGGMGDIGADGMKTLSALTVGPSNVWELEKGAKAWILEFNGHGLTFLENAVDSLQLQMQSLGGKLISAQRKAAALSSEAWALLETGDEATLLDVALTLERGLSLSLTMLSRMSGAVVGDEKKVVVELNKEFVRTDLTARELRAIQSLYERQLIPQDVLYYALREVNVIPVEYSLEDFKTLMGQKGQLYEPPPPAAPVGGAPAAGATGTRPPSPRPASKPPANNGPPKE